MNVTEFRQQHQEYNDISDEELGDKLYNKFYSDMPKQEFMSKFLVGDKQQSEQSQQSLGQKILSSAGYALSQQLNPQVVTSVARPVLESGGFIGGGLVGTAVAPGVGSLAGAGLGYAGGKQAANILEQFAGAEVPPLQKQLVESGKDILSGVAWEAGGLGAGAAISKGVSMIPQWMKHPLKTLGNKTALTEQGSKIEAAKKFQQESMGTPGTQGQIFKNIDIGRSLEEKIPGLKFTQGQLTNDASAISLERTLARKSGQDLSQSQREFAHSALRDFYSKKVSGTGNIGDLAKHTEKLNQTLQTATKEAEDAVQSEVMRLSRNLDEQAIGKNILGKLSVQKQGMKEKVGELFDQIPNLKVTPNPLAQKIDDVMGEVLPGEPKADIPIEAINLIKRHIIEKPADGAKLYSASGNLIPTGSKETIKDIDIVTTRGLNRTLNNMISKAESGLQPNKVLSRRLQMLKDGIEESYAITEQKGGQAGIDILKKANALRVEQGARFEKGTVADVLRRGPRGEDTRIAMANIAKEFDSLDGYLPRVAPS